MFKSRCPWRNCIQCVSTALYSPILPASSPMYARRAWRTSPASLPFFSLAASLIIRSMSGIMLLARNTLALLSSVRLLSFSNCNLVSDSCPISSSSLLSRSASSFFPACSQSRNGASKLSKYAAPRLCFPLLLSTYIRTQTAATSIKMATINQLSSREVRSNCSARASSCLSCLVYSCMSR